MTLLALTAALAFFPVLGVALYCIGKLVQRKTSSGREQRQLQKRFEETVRKHILSAFCNDFRLSMELGSDASVVSEDVQCQELLQSDFVFLRRHFRYYSSDVFVRAFSVPLVFAPSTGKSKSYFLYTQCRRFLLKSIKETEMGNLVNTMPHYRAHVLGHPNSLLPTLLGLFSFDNLGMLSKEYFPCEHYHFVLMENVFYDEQINFLKFDFKAGVCTGSWVGRQTLKSDNNLHHIRNIAHPVQQCVKMQYPKTCTEIFSPPLKEHDFKGLVDRNLLHPVFLGPTLRDGLLDQLEQDLAFLQQHNFMDYSVLMGVSSANRLNPVPNMSNHLHFCDVSRQFRRPEVDDGRSIYRKFQGSDGRIYSFGIVDTFSTFSLTKRCEKAIKGIWSNNILHLPPAQYQAEETTPILPVSSEDMRHYSVESPANYAHRIQRFVSHILVH
ncbi:hypothetical protein HDV03_000797 [Kappamyces sp. JEL0829]|nr:hypothetical protein HDV03_000797 [Kappamyces sp. JEL0829]